MLKRYSQLLVSAIMLCDAAVTGLAWYGAFAFRFYLPLFREMKNVKDQIPDIVAYSWMFALLLPVSLIANARSGLYEPRRIASFGREFVGILRSTMALLIVFIAIDFFVRNGDNLNIFEAMGKARFSRTFLVLFCVTHALFMVAERSVIRGYLRHARSKGRNLRYALILGAGKIGQSMARALRKNRWTGIEVKGFLDNRTERQGTDIRGLRVLGGYDKINELIGEHRIDQVFLALPSQDQPRTAELLAQLDIEHVDVFIVPDVLSYSSLRLDVGNFEGLPVINLREHAGYGWNMVFKRLFDIAFSLAALIVVAIPMAIIALLVKRGSPGPVFYAQERMGLDGKTFNMLKFRTMRQDAEAQTGAVWAKEDDPRRTALGTFLRKTSLDELPQFFNVLAGHMSVVGPRPERPVFIEEFRKTVPKYMLRHKIKAGITGWAQVNGWRGNTSLRKRIQFDIHYIENWSLGFDLYIILLTIFRGFVNKNAY